MWTRYSFPVFFWGAWILTAVTLNGFLFLIAALLTAGYAISLFLHPRARHRACNGTGELGGGIFGWTHRRCPGCQSGRIIRWGAGHAGMSHVRGQYQRQRQQMANTRSRSRW